MLLKNYKLEATKILNADILDVLFDGRNKLYGAYDLRKTYNRRIFHALLITAGMTASVAISFYVSNSLQDRQIGMIEDRTVTIRSIEEDKQVKKVEPPPPVVPKPQVQQVELTRFTPPRIVEDNQVNEKDLPPEVDDLANTKIDVINQEGTPDIGIATPPVIDDHKNIIEAPKVEDKDDIIVDKVEIEADFPGGPGAWSRFLQKNLNSNTPVDNGAVPGSYSVIVQFIVDKQGNISDVRALTNHGFGMEEEAIRVIKRGPKWIAAIQNGRNVNAYRRQPITFIVAE